MLKNEQNMALHALVGNSVLRDQFVVIKKNKDFSTTVPMVNVKK
jgi:hypothetical protein